MQEKKIVKYVVRQASDPRTIRIDEYRAGVGDYNSLFLEIRNFPFRFWTVITEREHAYEMFFMKFSEAKRFLDLSRYYGYYTTMLVHTREDVAIV